MKTFRTVVYIVLILAVFAVLVAKNKREQAHVSQGSKSSAAIAIDDAKAKKQPVWVLVHAAYCEPCKEMAALYSKLEPEFKGKVTFVNLDFDDPAEKGVVSSLNIKLIPTSVFIHADGKIDRRVGPIKADELKKILTQLQEK